MVEKAMRKKEGEGVKVRVRKVLQQQVLPIVVQLRKEEGGVRVQKVGTHYTPVQRMWEAVGLVEVMKLVAETNMMLGKCPVAIQHLSVEHGARIPNLFVRATIVLVRDAKNLPAPVFQ